MDPSLPLVTMPLAEHLEALVDGPQSPCASRYTREQTVPVPPRNMEKQVNRGG